MAVRVDLVVLGTDDALAPDTNRRLRLEHRCCFCPAAVARRPSGFRSRYRLRLPHPAKPAYALVAARSTDRDARKAAGTAAGDPCPSAVVSSVGAGRTLAHTSRLD